MRHLESRKTSEIYSQEKHLHRLNTCVKQAIKLRGKILESLPQTIIMVNDFVWKSGISTIVLLP